MYIYVQFQSAYEQFDAERKQRTEQIESKIEDANLSEQAKSALKEIVDLFSNTSITIGDERRRMKNILWGLNRNERKEVREVLRENRPNSEWEDCLNMYSYAHHHTNA